MCRLASVADSEATPYARLPVAAVRPPLVAPPTAAIAVCPRLVAFDGRQYEYAAWGPWEIEAGALSEIGLASGSNHPLTADEQRVYAIDGVPPATAIAMRPAEGEGVAVLLTKERRSRLRCAHISTGTDHRRAMSRRANQHRRSRRRRNEYPRRSSRRATDACRRGRQEGHRSMLGAAIAMPAEWRLMGVCVHRGPNIRSPTAWCARARGPSKKRLEGRGDSPEEALPQLAAPERVKPE